MFKSDISDGDSEDSDDHSSHLVCSQGSQWGRVWSPVETRLTAEVLDCRLPDIAMFMMIMSMSMIMIMIMMTMMMTMVTMNIIKMKLPCRRSPCLQPAPAQVSRI